MYETSAHYYNVPTSGMADNLVTQTSPVTDLFVGAPFNATAKIIFIIVGLLEVVCGVAGNVLLLSALLVLGVDSYHLLFIANLAVSDLLSMGYWMTFFVLDLIMGRHPVVNQAHCEANSFVVYACTAVSILSLTSISLNRYLHVCYNHLYSRVFSRRRIIIWCLLLWLVAAVACTPPLVGAGSYDYDPFSHTCSSLTGDPKNLYLNTTVTLFCSLSILLVGYWNFAIFRHWKRFKLKLSKRYPLSPEMKGKTTRVKRKQRGSEDDTELDTLQVGHPKQLDSITFQSSSRPDNDTNTTVAEQVLSHVGGVESSVVIQCRITKDQGPLQVGQPRSKDASWDKKKHAKRSSCSEETEFTGNVFLPNGRKILSVNTVSLKRDCSPEEISATRLSDDKMMTVSAPDLKSAECSLKVPSDTDNRHHIGLSRQYETRIHKERERERAFAWSLCVVLLLMLFCFVPFAVIEILEANGQQPPELTIPATLLLFLNNSVNWIVYGVMNRSFRRAYIRRVRRVMSKCKRRAARANQSNRSSDNATPATDLDTACQRSS